MSTPTLNGSPPCAFVRAWEPGDAATLAPLLREADRQEVLAASGLDSLTILRQAVAGSIIACSIVDRRTGGVIGMFGAVTSPLRESDGILWLLGADALTESPIARQLIEDSRRFCAAFHSRFDRLYVCVDERQAASVRWLTWLGFVLVKRHEGYGFEQRPFLEFVRINDV